MDYLDDNIITITAQESAERIDALLARCVPELTRSAAARLIEDGAVTVGGRTVRKNYKCAPGDEISLIMPEAADCELRPQDIPIDVVYEDDDLLVVNKARGMVVHPAPGHPDGTLVNALMFRCGDSLSGIGGEKRPGIVHRIDKDTSGLLIVAKNDFAHLALSAQLADRSLSRVYEAVVRGGMREDSGTVNAPIGRHPTDRKKMAVTQKGSRSAVTHWEVIARYRGYTHIRCRLETGRTHQIRVHMAWKGFPLFNDARYGGARILKGTTFSKYRQFVENCFALLPRQALHARCLGFVHPSTGREVYFESELPADFRAVLDRWENYAAHVRTDAE